MIRNILLVIFLGICISITGIFTVNNNEVAILKRGNTYSEFNNGTYWRIPLYDDITFVYTNERIGENNYEHNIEVDKQSYKINYSVNWQVMNPLQFVKYTDENNRQELNKSIESAVNLQLSKISKDGDLFAVINQTSLLSKVDIQDLGIRIINVNITGISTALSTNANSTDYNKEQESNLKLAQKIKESADNEYKTTLIEMQKKNDKFYQLYMKIYQLQHSTIAKESVPPLESFLAN